MIEKYISINWQDTQESVTTLYEQMRAGAVLGYDYIKVETIKRGTQPGYPYWCYKLTMGDDELIAEEAKAEGGLFRVRCAIKHSGTTVWYCGQATAWTTQQDKAAALTREAAEHVQNEHYRNCAQAEEYCVLVPTDG